MCGTLETEDPWLLYPAYAHSGFKWESATGLRVLGQEAVRN